MNTSRATDPKTTENYIRPNWRTSTFNRMEIIKRHAQKQQQNRLEVNEKGVYKRLSRFLLACFKGSKNG